MRVVQVWPKKYVSGKLIGFCDVGISIDGGNEYNMIWSGLSIFQGQNGIQVSLPSKKDEKGTLNEKTGKPMYHDIVKIPVTDDRPNTLGASFLAQLNEAVTNAYNEKFGSGSSNQTTTASYNKDNVGDTDLPF